MKTLLTVLLLLAGITSYSQTKYEYCQIQVIGKFNGKAKIVLDFGQDFNSLGWIRDRVIRDEMTGKAEQFNSAVDGINYMVSKGYEYIESYTLDVTGGSQLFFVFRKPIEEKVITNVNSTGTGTGTP